ncbi:MAG: hypothetical protein ACE5MH_06320, partial [Terriglobia bacterium]
GGEGSPAADLEPGGDGALPLELEYKQQLLELTSEAARQQSLLEQLESWLPQLRRLARVRKKAGGNGYGR